MKLFCLFTGGKDSTLAIKKMLDDGYDVDTVITFFSENPYSYMFHTVNIEWTYLHAISMDMAYYIFNTKGIKEKELLDLKKAFTAMKKLGYKGVVTGAIASKYQKNRVEKIARRVGLNVYSPLWNYDQEKLMCEYLKEKIVFMIISVSSLGLEEKHLGWIVNDINDVDEIIRLSRKYHFNPTGEGGEYESFVLDAPIFRYKIKIQELEKNFFGDSGYLIIKNASLEDK